MIHLFGEVKSLHGFVKNLDAKFVRTTLDKDKSHCLHGSR